MSGIEALQVKRGYRPWLCEVKYCQPFPVRANDKEISGKTNRIRMIAESQKHDTNKHDVLVNTAFPKNL